MLMRGRLRLVVFKQVRRCPHLRFLWSDIEGDSEVDPMIIPSSALYILRLQGSAIRALPREGTWRSALEISLVLCRGRGQVKIPRLVHLAATLPKRFREHGRRNDSRSRRRTIGYDRICETHHRYTNDRLHFDVGPAILRCLF
jgi:hypothetical protein